jgi:hypothetical protein
MYVGENPNVYEGKISEINISVYLDKGELVKIFSKINKICCMLIRQVRVVS